jgi:hypothetical protein
MQHGNRNVKLINHNFSSYMFRPILGLLQGELVGGKVVINKCIVLHMYIGWYTRYII